MGSYDPRHTVQTICRHARHAAFHSAPLHLYVYEEEPENLARHILLLSVLLDGSLLPKERMEMFLELHGNALLRARTADYLGECVGCGAAGSRRRHYLAPRLAFRTAYRRCACTRRRGAWSMQRRARPPLCASARPPNHRARTALPPH